MNETFNEDPVAVTAMEPGANGNFLVVGLGASAGGVQALRDFFSHVPADTNMAYVVILHLSPDHDSHLAEVLQNASLLPVTKVERRTRVEPDHVYVIPANKSLEIKHGHIDVLNMTSHEVRRSPVDILFRTLAQSHGPRAVSVVLSGTGANGSMGMKRVKEMGGLCIVQDPKEAEYNDMPAHSLATGLVDYVLSVAQIPARIIAYREQLKSVHIADPPPVATNAESKALRDIFNQLKLRTGHDFSNYKRPTVLRRIARRLGVHQLSDLTAYSRFMQDNPAEATALLKDLLISVTNFFRDPEAFEALERDIIPKLFVGKTREDQVRVWVAGCATGEEAYSVMMDSVEDYAILTLDERGHIQMWNYGAERMFGYTAEEVIGQHGAILFTPEDRRREMPAKEMATARETGRAADERWHIRKDGTRFYVSGVLSPLHDAAGAVTGYIKIARDLTQQLQAQEELRHANEELESRVRERTFELAKINESLRDEIAERIQTERDRGAPAAADRARARGRAPAIYTIRWVSK